MTTPTINTAKWIIRSAMREAKLLGKGQDPTSEDYAEKMGRLQEMVNLWQTQGIKLWLNTDYTLTLTQGQATYTFGPTGTQAMAKPLRVVDAYYSDQNQIRRPLFPLSWADWVRLSQINQQGALNQYFVDKQSTQLSVSFWLTPDYITSLGQAHLILQQQTAGLASINDSTLFPAEWALALVWGLADESASGQPQAIMDRCEKRASAYRQALEDWDVEDAPTRFTPDSQMFYQSGTFR